MVHQLCETRHDDVCAVRAKFIGVVIHSRRVVMIDTDN